MTEDQHILLHAFLSVDFPHYSCTIMIYWGLLSPLLSGGGLSVGIEVNQPPFQVGCPSLLLVSW